MTKVKEGKFGMVKLREKKKIRKKKKGEWEREERGRDPG